MPSGKIRNDNTRFLITIPKDLKEKAELVAEREDRSLSNLIVSLIRKYIDESSTKGDE